MSEPIHVVEPTLVDEAGHCHAFLGAVCGSSPQEVFHVWAGRQVGRFYQDLPQVTLHAHFVRSLRRIQAGLLYRRLLRAPGRILVPTAGATDLLTVDFAAKGRVPPGKATFFFHWIRPSKSKRARLGLVAKRQPNLKVLGAAQEIVDLLREVGFERCQLVPYPVSTQARPPEGPAVFRYLLFAGAARRDKGFGNVVDLVARLDEKGEAIPVAVQTSAKHYGKVEVADEIDRLYGIEYRALQTYPQTLPSAEYFRLFHGAICLQPYERQEFVGRVSAVTVDALASGAPVITTAGTWMGRTIERLDAGIALEDLSASALHAAACKVIEEYDRYSTNARKAAEAIQEENSGAHLVRAVLS
jgi:glycosyltransferase involved in cell wall biosynthesis